MSAVQPYLFFDGRCEEAIEYYRKTIGARVDKVMHAAFRVGDTQVLASTADDDAHARRVFNGLADGGNVTLPLMKTFFTSAFGMCTDKFGVHWMVISAQAQ